MLGGTADGTEVVPPAENGDSVESPFGRRRVLPVFGEGAFPGDLFCLGGLPFEAGVAEAFHEEDNSHDG